MSKRSFDEYYLISYHKLKICELKQTSELKEPDICIWFLSMSNAILRSKKINWGFLYIFSRIDFQGLFV